jgi:endonuclease/exonuclease/phosphatase family metal-dependent hydrolase
MKKNLLALVILIVSFLLVAGNAHVAVSQILPRGVYTIQQMSNGRYVDAYQASNQDYRLVTRTAQNNDSQKWIVTPLGKNTYTIQQKSNGRYVDAYQASNQDYRLVTRPTQNNDTQRWLILSSWHTRTIRVATFNIENLFQSGLPSDDRTAAIATFFNEIAADIWALQEIRQLGYLETYIGNISFFDDAYGAYYVLEEEGNSSYRPAIISRFPILGSTNHSTDSWLYEGESYQFHHNVLEADIDVDGKIVTIISIHLRPSTDMPSVRQREAAGFRLKQIVEAIPSSRALVVMGDFNDLDFESDPKSPTSRLGTVLHHVDARRPSGLIGTGSGETCNRVDYIFVSNSLRAGLGAKGVTIPYSVLGAEEQRRASDHAPVWAEVELKKW